MDPILQSVIIWIITGLLGLLGGWLLSWWRSERQRDRLLESGVRELLLCKLEQLRQEMVERGGYADDNVKARASRIYQAYQGLGGNGHGTQVNDDIQRAPAYPRHNRTDT